MSDSTPPAPTPRRVYLVRDSQGRFYQGWNWTTDPHDARLYLKVGTARAAITRAVRTGRTTDYPDLLEWTLDPAAATVIPMGETTSKALKRIETARVKRAQRELTDRLERLERDKARVDAELATIKATHAAAPVRPTIATMASGRWPFKTP